MVLSNLLTGGIDGGSIAATVARDGFAFLKTSHPEVDSQEIAALAGCTLTFGRHGPVHRVVPQSAAAPNTYSGIYGLNGFPLHSDMAHWRDPPRYMMLRCIQGHESVATVLADGFDVIDRAGEEKLTRALVKPRRRFNGSIPLLSIFRRSRHSLSSLLRWDEKFIVPASPAGEQGIQLVRKTLTQVKTMSVSLCDPGDTLWVDNWRMLHGRSAVSANQADRIIERAYLGELY